MEKIEKLQGGQGADGNKSGAEGDSGKVQATVEQSKVSIAFLT
jgi:hypothetical protein